MNVFSEERNNARQHFIKEYANTPDIGAMVHVLRDRLFG